MSCPPVAFPPPHPPPTRPRLTNALPLSVPPKSLGRRPSHAGRRHPTYVRTLHFTHPTLTSTPQPSPSSLALSQTRNLHGANANPPISFRPSSYPLLHPHLMPPTPPRRRTTVAVPCSPSHPPSSPTPLRPHPAPPPRTHPPIPPNDAPTSSVCAANSGPRCPRLPSSPLHHIPPSPARPRPLPPHPRPSAHPRTHAFHRPSSRPAATNTVLSDSGALRGMSKLMSPSSPVFKQANIDPDTRRISPRALMLTVHLSLILPPTPTKPADGPAQSCVAPPTPPCSSSPTPSSSSSVSETFQASNSSKLPKAPTPTQHL
ncbi:hypothetical protein OG21DRAFT_1144539 [Imleria badia]|nr:hypothetical protein OG21DRAFT_1144539 [Imleria badia]